MCEQCSGDQKLYIYNKLTGIAVEAGRHDAVEKAPLKNRKQTGFEISMIQSF